MSHAILYRAMFVRTGNGQYIPMTETGDSNMWDAYRNRVSRNWESNRWSFETEEQRRRYALTEEEILGLVQEELDILVGKYAGRKQPFTDRTYTRQDVLDDVGYFGAIRVSGHSVTTARHLAAFFRSGVRNAVTFGDLKASGCRIRLSWWDGDMTREEFFPTEEDLDSGWKRLLDRGIVPYVSLDHMAGSVWTGMKLRRQRDAADAGTARKKPRPRFAVVFSHSGHPGQDCYVYVLTLRRMRFGTLSDHAHRYISRGVAEKAAKRVSDGYEGVGNLRVVDLSAKDALAGNTPVPAGCLF